VIYLDSTVLVYAALDTGPTGRWCQSVLDSVQAGRDAATSVLTLDEVQYKVRKQRGEEDSIAVAELYLTFPHLTLISADVPLVRAAVGMTRRHHLFPRDALHAASALSRGIREIYSEDRDFDRLKELKRVWRGASTP